VAAPKSNLWMKHRRPSSEEFMAASDRGAVIGFLRDIDAPALGRGRSRWTTLAGLSHAVYFSIDGVVRRGT
jgi:hypothetical protein